MKMEVTPLLENIVDCYIALNSVLNTTANNHINYEIMNKVLNLSKIAIIPTATIILSLIMYSEVCERTLDMQRNGFSQNTSFSFVLTLCFSLGISYIVVSYSPKILFAITEVADNILNNVISISIGTGTQLSAPTVEELGRAFYGDAYNANYKIPLGDYMFSTMIIGISKFASWLASLSVSIVMYSREISIYTLTALAPIALATIPHKEHSHIAKSFIRTYVATALISVVLVISLKVLSLIIYTIPSAEISIDGYAKQVLLISIVQITTIFGSATLSKKIISAM